MRFERASGILLHPTSLPSPGGIGSLGKEAYRWIDFLTETGCRYWQILPLGPTGYGDSPYQCFSAFAGNPYLIDLDYLVEDNLLSEADVLAAPDFDAFSVDFGKLIEWKNKLLLQSFINFHSRPFKKLSTEYNIFTQANSFWLDDYSLFMGIKELEGGKSWDQWSDKLRTRDKAALGTLLDNNNELFTRHKFYQFLFFRQWKALHKYANKKGILIIGDVPIFVSFDSADAWANPELFYFDKNLKPTVVAGVPPDYFSPTGQLWGNPLYKWDVHKTSGYEWWKKRIRSTLEMVDIIRLDHFRGFIASWQVRYGDKTAEKGRWVPGPGEDLFYSFQEEFGNLPIIAEDLGVITPQVVALREKFSFPGMLILQFAFNNNPSASYLPHNFSENSIVYTGTHDNNTALGWYSDASEIEKDFCRRYLARSGEDIAWDLIRAAWSSVSSVSVAQMQDFLSLGSPARMNFPGKASGNWTWRMAPGQLTVDLAKRIREVNFLYSRLSSPKK